MIDAHTLYAHAFHCIFNFGRVNFVFVCSSGRISYHLVYDNITYTKGRGWVVMRGGRLRS